MDLDLSFTENNEDIKTNEISTKAFDEHPLDYELEVSKTPEEKIKTCLAFMAKVIAVSGAPRFKEFWDAKRKCLEYFKDLTSSRLRAQLWGQYIDLSTEAKRLKEIIDEQSNFAAEQIDLAIQSLEKDLSQMEMLWKQMNEVALLWQSITIKNKEHLYNDVQRELYLLNTLASRVNSLRKELVKTEMRLGLKSKLFDRLSISGDKVFPRRKELIRFISDQFMQDVDNFISNSIKKENRNLYEIREEIKTLQALAKELTLNTQAFSETRIKLSQCWDNLKEEERIKKKAWDEKKEQSKKIVETLQSKIADLSQKVQGGISYKEAETIQQMLFKEIKEASLLREDERVLKQEIQEALASLLQKQEEEKQQKKRQQELEEQQKKERLGELYEALNTLFERLRNKEDIALELKEVYNKVQQSSIEEKEKQALVLRYHQLEDAFKEEKLQWLLSLETPNLDELYDLYDERWQTRDELRKNSEEYRQKLGGSGFDFEKAMLYREAMEAVRARLEEVQKQIEALEKKISQLEE